MALTADQIRDAIDEQIATVDVPEWGGQVCIKSMTVADREKVEAQQIKCGGSVLGLRASLLSRTLCDEHGNLIYDGQDRIAEIEGKNSTVIDRLFAKAMSVNGISEESQKDLEGNSDGPLG